MGLFDKGSKKPPHEADDFDSPVEQVALTPQKPPRPAAPPPPDPPLQAHYGIQQAIELMRLLPVDSNPELVCQVIKKTLESTQIKVHTIIEDASRKQKDIENRVQVLRQEIGDLEQEIARRRDEIKRLEDDHSETTRVKDHLVLAERLTEKGAPPAPPPPAQAHASEKDKEKGKAPAPPAPPDKGKAAAQ
jgi:hypothetical protein